MCDNRLLTSSDQPLISFPNKLPDNKLIDNAMFSLLEVDNILGDFFVALPSYKRSIESKAKNCANECTKERPQKRNRPAYTHFDGLLGAFLDFPDAWESIRLMEREKYSCNSSNSETLQSNIAIQQAIDVSPDGEARNTCNISFEVCHGSKKAKDNVEVESCTASDSADTEPGDNHIEDDTWYGSATQPLSAAF